MSLIRLAGTALAAGLLTLVAGCGGSTAWDTSSSASRPAVTLAPSPTPTTVAVSSSTAPAAATAETPAAASSAARSPALTPDIDPRTQPASLNIPTIDVEGLKVVPYEGTTDDWPGTRIQDRGVAASPYGARGGVGPGEKGNYLVTAHRLSAGGPLRDLPALDEGDTVRAELGNTVYIYKITETRVTSFRSASSLAEQRAAVPGFPGKTPTQAMITISTCATPEDNAAGNFWRDDKNNPEHRIDKIGTLIATERPSGGSS